MVDERLTAEKGRVHKNYTYNLVTVVGRSWRNWLEMDTQGEKIKRKKLESYAYTGREDKKEDVKEFCSLNTNMRRL